MSSIAGTAALFLLLLPTIIYAHTICPASEKMKDHQVDKFVSMHNSRRINLANGQVMKGNGNYMPRAANMQKLSYNCTLEEEAIARAEGCLSKEVELGEDAGENTAKVPLSSASDKLTAIQNGVTSWWKQVRTGPNIGNKAVYRSIHTPSAQFARMAWATTSELGCAVNKCSSFYAVVCRYAPSDMEFEQPIYEPGTPCTSCPDEFPTCVDKVLCGA